MTRRTLSEIRKGEIIHPTGYNIKVLVDADSHEEKTESGIIIKKNIDVTVDQLKRGTDRGIVTELGPLAGTVPGETPETWGIHKLGNIVYFKRYEGDYFEEQDGKAYIFIKDSQIIAYIDPEETT